MRQPGAPAVNRDVTVMETRLQGGREDHGADPKRLMPPGCPALCPLLAFSCILICSLWLEQVSEDSTQGMERLWCLPQPGLHRCQSWAWRWVHHSSTLIQARFNNPARSLVCLQSEIIPVISKGEPGALGWSVPPGEGQILLQPGTLAHGWDSRWDKPGGVQTPGVGSM